MKILLTITFIFLFSIISFGQTTEDNLRECSQLLTKSATQVNACQEQVKSRDEAIENLEKRNKELEAMMTTIIEKADSTIKAQQKEIDRLIKIKCSKSSFLLFVYKSKKCY